MMPWEKKERQDPVTAACAGGVLGIDPENTPMIGRGRVRMRKRKVAAIVPGQVQLLTVPQVAEVLGIGSTKVYDLIHRHGLPAVQIDGRLRVRLSSLLSWVEARESVHRCCPPHAGESRRNH
jgi:excisionase family DNA binding protein